MSGMDGAVPEETLRKIFRAKKTMKVSNRKQLEFLHTSLPSPRSVPTQPPQAIVHVELSEDAVSMEVDDEIHGTTHTAHPTTPSPTTTTTSLTSETCKRKSSSIVASSQNTHVIELWGNETEGDKESKQPSLEEVENMNGMIKGHRNPTQDVIPGYHVTSERADELMEKDIVGMEICLLPVSTQDTVPVLDPASCPLLSPITAVQSTSSPSLSPTHTAETDPDVRPGFLVLSEDDDDDVQDESDVEKDEEQCENEDRCVETLEVNMKKPEQFESGSPVDCSFPSSPLPLQIDEDVESNGALQGKQALFVDSEECGQELGERDLEVVETPHKRPRIDCEELETHVEIKISGSADKQSKLKKVVQQLVDEHLRVLQITLFDQSLQELRERMDRIDKQQRLHSNLKRLQAKFDRLSTKVGTANQAKEIPDKISEVLLPSACTDATATSTLSATTTIAPASSTDSAPASSTVASTSASAIVGLRMLVNNIPNPKCIDQRGQVTTHVSSGSPLLPSPSIAFSTESEALMLSSCVTPTPVHSGFSLQPLLIQLPGRGTAIFSNPTSSRLIPMSALTTLTNSTPTHTTAFILQRSTPYTSALPTDPSASALLSHYAASLTTVPTTITAPIDMPAATTSHMTTPITTLRTAPTTLARTTPTTLARTTPTTLARTTPTTLARTTPTTLARTTPTTLARTTPITTSRYPPITTSWTTPITTSRNMTMATLTTSSWVTSTTTHTSITTATTMATPTSWTTPTITPKATTTTTSKATTKNLTMATTTPITPSCAMANGASNIVHLAASGTVNKPSSGVSVSVCESTSLVSLVNSTSSASVPRLSVPGTTVQQAVPAQLACPVEPQVPIKTGSQATNPPLDLTKTFHCNISEAFIDLTEDDDDDDDVLVTGVLQAPMVLKASPMPPTAGQQTTITQQTTTSTPVGKKAVRFSLDHTLAGTTLEIVSHRPLQQGLPSENAKETTSTSSCQTSPVPPLPAVPPTLSLPLEAVNTKPPQQPLLKLTQVQTKNNGIVLSWSVTEVDRSCAAVDCYHLYAYHQEHSGPADTDATSSSWKKIGEVKALALPMACTLTQFVSGAKYYFVVHARDVYGRFGPFCEPQCTDVLMPTSSDV
ncbi:activating transcription factor 7-interacting protein 1 isoform X1 [Esox lucius]|nr:activating transcription factor 7-interacting protein 1 isoform X1 [Esox lucius]